jgi:hypothetical protein
MKFPKPFFRQSKKAWYLQLGKRQISLGKDRKEAFRRYRETYLNEYGDFPDSTPQRRTVAEIFDLFLEWAKGHTESYDLYRNFLQDFARRYGSLLVANIRPFHVARWLDSKSTWGSTTQNKVIGIIKRAFNLGEAQGLLIANPVKRMPKPQSTYPHEAITLSSFQSTSGQRLSSRMRTGLTPFVA